jgi:uncharacterized protein (TIGR03437 family)
MRLVTVPFVVLCAAALALPASASVASFGPTSQNITFTGLGGNAQGEGQSQVTWGSCVFANGNTTCTVSAPFTGLGPGGTITAVIAYAGNGPSPIVAGSVSPGSNQVSFSFNGSSSGSIVTTLTETNGTTLTFDSILPNFSYGLASCTGVSNCSVGEVGLTPGATITGQVSGSFDATPVIRSAISASSFGAFTSIAPGTWVEIYGTNLASNPPARTWASSDFTGVNAPTQLGGTTTTVTIGGQPAFIDYVSPTQVNVQVPSNVPTGGLQQIVVTTAGGSSLPDPVQVNAVQPGMLAPLVFQVNGNQYIVALYPDGVTYVLPPGVTSAVPTKRASVGDTLIFYGIGFGPVTPNIPAGQIAEQTNSLQSPLQVSFGGVPAKVTYYGLTPTYVGLYQFNVVVPNVPASDTILVTFTVGTTAGTQNMVISVGN